MFFYKLKIFRLSVLAGISLELRVEKKELLLFLFSSILIFIMTM